MLRLWIAALLLLCIQSTAFAQSDARMKIDITAAQQNVEVRWLHAHIQKAADLALPELWRRMIPQHAMDQIPKHVKAVRFLQKAVPNDLGVSITFDEKRVLSYLKHNNIPYYAEQSADSATIEPQATQPMMDEPGQTALAQAPLQAGLLTIERHHASLPEQVLFEDDLAHDPRVFSLTLRQVNRDQQQYRLQLKSSDDLWLMAWFSSRGMTLTQSFDGWVAR
ncbi:MAG: hypothetical protein Q9M82_01100 [Mariprofundus sp.]|nr:hypothetical protein [Mariprofundus sp.]